MSDDARSDVRSAIQELRAIRSTDPGAAIAMTTIKATIHTLESRWLPPSTVPDRRSAGPAG